MFVKFLENSFNAIDDGIFSKIVVLIVFPNDSNLSIDYHLNSSEEGNGSC